MNLEQDAFPLTEVSGEEPFFMEEDYLELYPDVRAAVEAGVFLSGHDHWKKHGQKEGRQAFSFAVRLQKFAQASGAAQRCAAALGSPAPRVPGLRGRLGALALALIDRLLWWHLRSMRQFGESLARRDQAEIDALTAIEVRVEELSAVVAERFDELQSAQLHLQSVQLRYISREEMQ